MGRRKIESAIFKALMYAAVAAVVGGLLAIIVMICWRGLPALSVSMLTQTPKGGYYLGKEGGILNAIAGSLYLAVPATILSLAIALPVALFLQKEYAGKTWLAACVRFALDILWGIPSIVYGACGFIIMLYLGMRASLLGGIITLTLLEIPIIVRGADEVIRKVSPLIKEASDGLGALRSETAFKVVLRQAAPGIMTAVMLALGRGIGDAASMLFTAGYSDRIPSSLLDPVASLPLAIFFQLGTPYPEVRERAYAAALVLLVIVLLISVFSRLLVRRYSRFIIK